MRGLVGSLKREPESNIGSRYGYCPSGMSDVAVRAESKLIGIARAFEETCKPLGQHSTTLNQV